MGLVRFSLRRFACFADINGGVRASLFYTHVSHVFRTKYSLRARFALTFNFVLSLLRIALPRERARPRSTVYFKLFRSLFDRSSRTRANSLYVPRAINPFAAADFNRKSVRGSRENGSTASRSINVLLLIHFYSSGGKEFQVFRDASAVFLVT